MNHLLVCREYPPAPGGGIGTYSAHLAALLAHRGETVHVIGQQWHGAARAVERQHGGRLVIHRLPYANWASVFGRAPHPCLPAHPARDLFASHFPPLAFAWQAVAQIEWLIEHAAIDLIEAPEYEAPLYFFLLRRALGLGPRRRPPCLVHLHSPTEFIARYNDWPLTAPEVAGALQLEAYVMSAADGLLCPSRALAGEAAAHFGAALGEITVIPLPLGPDPGVLPRDAATWAHGSVAYVGRLERRKGALEYLQAAVTVAQEDPSVLFEFAGGNILGRDPVESAALLEQLIPRRLRARFRFRGALPPAALPNFLRCARLAVVPSRWENFPYVCVEALRSGLPALVTPVGAMPQMVTDACSGWVADGCHPHALAQGLRRGLAASPAQRQAMGAEAARAVRSLCDNESILTQQLVLRHALVKQGAVRSVQLPPVLPFGHHTRLDRAARRQPARPAAGGLALLVVAEVGTRLTAGCLRALVRQSEAPVSVWVAATPPRDPLPAHWHTLPPGLEVQAAVQAVLAAQPRPAALAVLTARDEPPPDFVAACRHLLEHCPEVGLAGGWQLAAGSVRRLAVPVCPAFPFQWHSNAVGLPLLVRAEALAVAGGFPAGPLAAAGWELVNAMLAAGWVGVTYPAAWHLRRPAAATVEALPAQARARFARLLQREAGALAQRAAQPNGATMQPALLAWPSQWTRLVQYARHPRLLARLIAWLARRLLRAGAHAPTLWLAALAARPADTVRQWTSGHG